jgi:UDP:flavonoid glycosyltransferase YjiC (YdhE family)
MHDGAGWVPLPFTSSPSAICAAQRGKLEPCLKLGLAFGTRSAVVDFGASVSASAFSRAAVICCC